MSQAAIGQLEQIAERIHRQLVKGQVPEMQIPTRSKSNIIFDDRQQVWKYGSARTTRTAKKLDGAYMLLRTTYLLDFIRDMVGQQKSSTLRELYYISEGWELGKFHSQDESNKLIEDLEIVTSFQREDFKIRPEEDGAKVLGNLTLTEINRKGKQMRINCRDDVGDTGYGIPYNVEPGKITFNNFGDARCIMAIETGGMFDRLVENGFDEDFRAGLIHLKGQPARSTRRIIKRMNEEWDLPVVVFLDGDPWSFRIYASIAYGAIKTAHISEYLATPSADYLGITADDIGAYDLPSDDLSPKDIEALKAELTDPRFSDGRWQQWIKDMLEMGKKAEQQSLAKYGLDYVTDEYLPEKLKQLGLA